MTGHRTQRDRVLAALEGAGAEGVSWLTFAAEPPDGGAPIAHLAGVVRQLRDDGHRILTIPARTSHGTRYWRFVLADLVEPQAPAERRAA